MSFFRAPIIVIGMHRSGTALVTRLLERLGLFAGQEKDPNDEALFFQDLNRWMFAAAGAAWDHPGTVRLLADDAELRGMVASHLRNLTRTEDASRFLGPDKSVPGRGLSVLDVPWGWKDPRNTFTLPIWLDVFPKAKVLHVRRHGVDVAWSLKLRSDAYRDHVRRLFRREGRFEANAAIADSLRCASLHSAFSLWEEYVDEAQRHVERLGARATDLRFEDLVEDPPAALGCLARFAALPRKTGSILVEAASSIEAARSRAFQSVPDLASFADSVSDRLKARGY